MTEAGLFDCFDSPEAKDNAASDLQKLFHSSGFQSIVNGNQCIRQAMLEQIDVTSPNCNMCTHCRRSNPYLRQTALAQQRVRSRAENKQYVLNNMMGLLRQCFVCGEAVCYGTRCLMPNHTRCVKCHGPARQHNAHDPRECKAKHIPLYGRAACILCFLPKAVKMDDGLIRESQTADMYRFLGHYDRPYTPGSSQACVLPPMRIGTIRYNPGTFFSNH